MMKFFFLVLLLILNVYAEAKGSGSIQRGKVAKKEKSTVVEKKSVSKSKAKNSSKRTSSAKRKSTSNEFDAANLASLDSANYVVADSRNFTGGDASQSGISQANDLQKNVVVVRDTVVDTVYVVYKDSSASRENNEVFNVPLPHQCAYLGKGFSVGLGAGVFNASEDCDCLGVWQALVDFYYNDVVSSGVDIRIFGGTIDRDMMLMYQRYRVNLRFHKGYSGADFYFSTLLGLETTDLSEFRKELREGVRSDDPEELSETNESDDNEAPLIKKNCEKMFSLDGFTLGVEAGMGLVMFRYLGLVGSASYEFNFSWAQLVTFTPGIAFNLHEVWPWAHRNLRSTWISFEMIFQRYFNRDVNEWALAGFLGVQFGI